MKPRAVILATLLVVTGGVSAQDFPAKPVRIVTSPAGGSADFVARLVAQGISGPLGQQVLVDNRPSIVIAEAVAKAPPDGYTLVLVGNSFFVGSLLQPMPYDSISDFSPVTLTNRAPNILVVHPALPVRSVKELIALAKARPGELHYTSGVTGSSAHLGAELFNAMAHVRTVRVNYKGAGLAVTSLIAGEVQLTFGAADVLPHVKSGRLRALAVTSLEPTELVPGLPTVAAALPGYESVQRQGILAPAKTPAAIINRLNQEMVRVLNTKEVKDKFFNAGVEAVGSSPEQFTATLKSELARMGKVIQDAGIKVE